MFMQQIKALQQTFNEGKGKSDKVDETIQLLQKDLKLAKAARKLAENSTYLH